MRRYWLLAAGILCTTLLQAQFGFYVEGGPNYSMIRATRSAGIVDGKGEVGWQLGGGVEYHFMNDFFMYMGTNFSSQTFLKDSSSINDTVVSKYNIHPYFINVPFGFAYQFNFTKTLGLKVYAGLNTQIGVAGKLKRRTDFYTTNGNTTPPEHVRSEYDNHKINFGRDPNVSSDYRNDLGNTIWGLNIGAGLNINKRLEANIFYQEGLNNILPGGDGAPEINKLRSVTVNLRFYFPGKYYNEGYKE